MRSEKQAERGRRTLAVEAIALASICCVLPLAADDGLLYYVEDGGVVITNVPGRRDARPIPGLAVAEIVVRSASNLPTTPYDPYIDRLAAELGVDPNLIKAVALVESALDPRAVSPKGAQGLMQLMPATALHYGVTDPFDPYQNLRAGATHLRDLLHRYDGDRTLALAAYNAGPTAVRRHGGVPAYRETREYVARVENRLQPGASPERRAGSTRPRPRPIRTERRADGTVVFRN